ncbi:MAG: 1-acyl-sn-glycerol-3-phosphate acyltransferase [Erysipelotrichaceae bacterium]|jgi:1-acyl-sn-glycerol-3-phosphate acyltransferase|nr:1-acyl-sn-glycerol-3-phosphate acyltransferase [Erysipelotrichaceae bacterium]
MKIKTKRPPYFLYLILVFLLKVFAFLKGQRFEKKLKIKGPALCLSNHTTWFDFAYTMNAIYPRMTRFIAAEKMFLSPKMGPFLKLAHSIPKKLYATDHRAVLEVFKELKRNGIVSLFPEGQIATLGRSLEIGFSIAKLIKKSEVNVYLIKHQNASFRDPPWGKHSFPGKFTTKIELLFSKAALETLSEIEIYQTLRKAMFFDPYAFNKTKKWPYRVKSIEGLTNVIYECPSCQSKRLMTIKDQLFCHDCHAVYRYDQHGYLGGLSLVEHYQRQYQRIKDQYLKDPSFKLESDVLVEGYVGNKVLPVGEGHLIANQDGYHFQGTYQDQPLKITFPFLTSPSLPSDLGRNIQIYHEDNLYQFVFKYPYEPMPFVLFGELMANETLPLEKRHGTLVMDDIS